MRNWILGGFLACITSAGVAYVLAKNSTGSHCGPCIEKPATFETVLKDRIPGRCDANDSQTELSYPHCKPSGSNGVVDVVDLDHSFRMADGSPKPTVSFEEPPLAKPRGAVLPVKFEEPVKVETLPMPREVQAEPHMFQRIKGFLKESMPITLPSPHYLKHYPNYFSPDPEFPLQRERDALLDSKNEVQPAK